MTYYSRTSLSSGRPAYGVAARQRQPQRRASALDVAAPRWQIKPILIAAALLVLGLIIWNGMHSHAAAQQLKAEQQRQQAAAAHSQTINKVVSQVQGIVANYPQVSFSIDVQTLGSAASEQRHVGNTAAQDAGSVGKLLTAATWLNQVENGQQSSKAKLGGQASTDLLKALIVNSDDQAWQLFNDRLNHASLQNFAQQQGINDYDADSNYLSSTSVNKLLAQLWGGKLLNKTNTQQLLNYMKQANYRDYIVAGAPTGTIVFHKVGIDGDHVNDAAIITKGDKAMSLVIMTDGHDTYNWPQRAEAMQQITNTLATAYLN